MNVEGAGVNSSKDTKLIYQNGGLHVVRGSGGRAEKEKVPPKAEPTTKKPSNQNQKDSTSQKKAEKKYRAKEFVAEGNATVIADPSIEANTVCSLSGVGKLMSGHWYIETVVHTWSREGYNMELELKSNAAGGMKPPVSTSRKATVTPKTSANKKTHVIKSGETLQTIARIYYGSSDHWNKIWEANKSMLIARDKRNQTHPGRWLYPNQILIIP